MNQIFLFIVSFFLVSFTYAQAALPDFNQYHNVKQKKQKFFSYLKPIASKVNQQIQKERNHLLALKKKKQLTKNDQAWLNSIAHKYGVPKTSAHNQISKLLPKVDTIPTSLLLAQAANESAWGTSRFARLGNNLFGQWCYKPHCGIVPSHRSRGMHHEVQKFYSPYAAVLSYANNLNRNRPYSQLRSIRANLRKNHQKVTGLALAQGLSKYSERGQSYVRDIKSMIRGNHLQKYD